MAVVDYPQHGTRTVSQEDFKYEIVPQSVANKDVTSMADNIR